MSLKVYIQEPWGLSSKRMFAYRGFDIVDTPEECDIICFNGGEDINPELYGETPLPRAGVYFDQKRDLQELAGYRRAKDKFKFGICRGGQLLNVLNGGKLWQDVSDHTRTHDMVEIATGRVIRTSSVHHQQFILGPDAELVCKAELARSKLGGPGMWWRGSGDPKWNDDPEVVWYPKDRALCIQGHPEYGGNPELTDYSFELIKRYI